jgi:hypothetical protein
MNSDELLRFMKRVIVWIPFGNPIRNEINSIINQIQQQKEKLPPVDIVVQTANTELEVL